MNDTLEQKTYCLCGDLELGTENIKDMSDYLSVVGCTIYTLATHRYDDQLFGYPSVRFFQDSEPVMALTGTFDLLEIINGMKDYEQIEFNLTANPSVMAGMMGYSIVFPTKYSPNEDTITYSAYGLFLDINEAHKKDEALMNCMLDIIQNILLNGDEDEKTDN